MQQHVRLHQEHLRTTEGHRDRVHHENVQPRRTHENLEESFEARTEAKLTHNLQLLDQHYSMKTECELLTICGIQLSHLRRVERIQAVTLFKQWLKKTKE